MPLTSFLLYSALRTVLWTTALAYAGVVLQSNVTIVGDYIDTIAYVVLGVMGVIVARRYVNCWKASSDSAGSGQGRVRGKIEKASS